MARKEENIDADDGVYSIKLSFSYSLPFAFTLWLFELNINERVILKLVRVP